MYGIGNDKQHQKSNKQDACDFNGKDGQAAKPQKCSNKCQDQE